jgi:hypothetical protein
MSRGPRRRRPGFLDPEERKVFYRAIRFAIEQGFKHPSMYALEAVKRLREQRERDAEK